MTTLILDTYKIINRLQAKGYTKEQAEGFVEALQEINLEDVATRGDIKDLKTAIAESKFEILKWVIPLVLGLYALILVKMQGG